MEYKIIQQRNLPPGDLEIRIKKMVQRDVEEFRKIPMLKRDTNEENKGLAESIKKMVQRDMEEFRKMPMIKRDTNEENKGLTESIKKMVQRDIEEFKKMPMIKRDTGDIKYSKKSKTRKQSKN